MKKILFILLFSSLSSILFSQNKLFTIEDVVLNSYSTLRPEKLKQLKWIADTDNYSFISKDKSRLLTSSANSNENKTILEIDEFNKALSLFDEKPFKNFPVINWTGKDKFNFNSGKKYFSFNLSTKKATLRNELETDAENISIAPNQYSMAYTVDNNLKISPEPGKVITVTNETNKGILNGHAVHQHEFGISKGIFWSPNSNYVAYYRMDESMVPDYPILEVNKVPMTVRNIKYPMAGKKSHHVSIGIYDIKSQKTVWLQTNEPKEHYYTCITWGPEEKFIYVTHLNRDQNHSKLVKYEISTGKRVKILIEEKDPQFVEPEDDLIFLPGKSDEFLVFSERSGFKHLFHYNTEGKLIRQITKGEWVVTEFNGFDKDSESIYITSTKETPTDRHLYKVNLYSGEIEKLTKISASHSVSVNAEAGYYFDSFSSLEIPNITDIVDLKGNVVKNINAAHNPLSEYKTGKTEILKIKADDGTDLFCRITLPVDFDPTVKYPAIVYVYGGPHSQDVTNVWPVGKYKIWDQMMAQKGFVVFYVDNRGTDNRGTDFEQITHRRLGTIEVADQLKGVEYLINTGFVDKSRIGCWGWSYGGFMTTSMMTRTDAFKVGVAGGAVIDWGLYEIMYTERYMDTPQQNPEGFESANLLNHIKNLKGKKLLMVHGTSDPVVVWQHSLQYASNAANHSVPLDYYPYVGHGHGVRGKDGLQLYNKITSYFLENL